MTEDRFALSADHAAGDSAVLPNDHILAGGRRRPIGRGLEWLTEAWAFAQGQRGIFLGVFVLAAIGVVALSLIPLLGGLATTLLMPVISGGFMLGCDAVRRGHSLEIKHLFAGFERHAGKLIGIGALSLAIGLIIVIVVIAIVGVSFLPMLTGAEQTPEAMAAMGVSLVLAVLVALALSIPCYMALWFAPPLIVLHDLDVGDALKASFFGCLKNILPFLLYGVITLILGMVATLPLALGWLLFGPVLWTSLYVSYRDVYCGE